MRLALWLGQTKEKDGLNFAPHLFSFFLMARQSTILKIKKKAVVEIMPPGSVCGRMIVQVAVLCSDR